MTEQRKKELLAELIPYLTIKDRLKVLGFVKALFENSIIMLIWFSCFYAQDIYSFPLFLMLAIYTYWNSSKMLAVIRVTVCVLFVLQYFAQLIDFSSYNTLKPFPSLLLGEAYTVYPNPERFYFGTPFNIWMRTEVDTETGQYTGTINLEKSAFWGLKPTTESVNGIWWDFSVIIAISIYYSVCNLWLLFRPIKIVLSKTSKAKLREYQTLCDKVDIRQ